MTDSMKKRDAIEAAFNGGGGQGGRAPELETGTIEPRGKLSTATEANSTTLADAKKKAGRARVLSILAGALGVAGIAGGYATTGIPALSWPLFGVGAALGVTGLLVKLFATDVSPEDLEAEAKNLGDSIGDFIEAQTKKGGRDAK